MDRFIKRGQHVDIVLVLGMQDGLFFGVKIEDKEGRLLDEFQFRIDKKTVIGWVRGMLFR